MVNFCSFCVYMRIFSCFGVSADLRLSYDKRGRQIIEHRYADRPKREFLRPYADTPNMDEILPEDTKI